MVRPRGRWRDVTSRTCAARIVCRVKALGVRQSRGGTVAVWIFVLVPFLALIAAVPVAWGRGLSLVDVVVAAAMYAFCGFGVTVGYHRLFTHRSFKASRPLRIVLAVAGLMAAQGSVTQWVANHRRHHAFSDRDGDPHSPWRYGTSPASVLKGLWFAHVGWMFRRELSNKARFAPDLLADKDIRVLDRIMAPLLTASLLLPAVIGLSAGGSWQSAASAFFWAGLVRMAVLHHVTWSVNSLCHVVGERPFATRDRATNLWPLAVVSLGESWHNAHHADPTAARHGVLRGQVDPSARLIWLLERLGWTHDVRWPKASRPPAGTQNPGLFG